MHSFKFIDIGLALCIGLLTGCGLGGFHHETPNEPDSGPNCLLDACENDTSLPCPEDECESTPVSCQAIEDNPDWELCQQTDSTCVGVFYDGAGCQAFCESVGLLCSETWENLDGECAPDDARTPLSCGVPSGHQSDWCMCVEPCECTPDCTERECGDDGCGGSCGECDGEASCEFGECVVDEPDPLLSERVGYGGNTTGGDGGATCTVTHLNDSGTGSLRACAQASGKQWIVFAVDGDIHLKSRIQVGSDKTIDGRGRHIRISGHGLNISDQSNILLVNLIFHDGNGGEDNDAITIRNRAHDIWIHHCSFSDYGDGLVDIKEGATDITVSWSKFSNHDKVMLISASTKDTGDERIRVTIHHNWFQETRQRHPRLRFGRAHIFNNYFDQWKNYGIGCSYRGQCRSENNIFEAATDKDAIVDQVGVDPEGGQVRSDGEWLLNGARVNENDRSSVFDPRASYAYSLQTANSALRSEILLNAGQQ